MVGILQRTKGTESPFRIFASFAYTNDEPWKGLSVPPSAVSYCSAPPNQGSSSLDVSEKVGMHVLVIKKPVLVMKRKSCDGRLFRTNPDGDIGNQSHASNW